MVDVKEKFLLLFLLICNFGFAQNQNVNWHFGNQVSVNFKGTVVTYNTSSKMVSIEACASVSDRITGNMLFYSDGLQIWNKNNIVMPNGGGILGGNNTSSTQGVLVVPYPGDSLKYFLFTIDESPSGALNGFRYSIVDMSLDGGLGDVVINKKNLLIQNNIAEKISYTKTNDGSGFWVVVHERDNTSFKAYKITSNGINTNPVISSVGTVHTSVYTGNGDGTMGCIKFNKSGTKLATTIYSLNKVEIFDFDNCSGSINNPTSVTTLDNPYGLEFSPDDSKLYYSLYYNAGFQGAVYQLNMLATNVASTASLVGISSSLNSQCMGALQLAPDNKIYIAINGESWLSAIANPNTLGIGCTFIDKAITLIQSGLSPSPGYLGLPQSVLFTSNNGGSLGGSYTITANNFCYGNATQFQLTPNSNINKVLWNFGDTFSSSNTDTFKNTSHIYTDTGSYNVKVVIVSQCKTDTANTTIKIEGKDESISSITICNNQLPYLWNGNLYNVAGNYTVTKKDMNGCDSICQLILSTKSCDTLVNSNCSITVPNAFSPNGDGINDFFLPNITCTPQQYHIIIYSRWGQPLFSTNNYKRQWLGKYNNKDVPVGVFYYVLNIKFPSEEKKVLSGYLTLIR